MTSIDVIAQSMLQISENIFSIKMSACILSECRGYMAQMVFEMKKMNELLEKINCEELE